MREFHQANPVKNICFPDMQGFTLTELTATIAIVAIMIALAVPSFNDSIERRRLRGAAEAVEADIQFARMEAIKESVSVRMDIKVQSTSAAWCSGMSLTSCDCQATPPSSCQIGGVEKTINGANYKNVQIAGTSPLGGAAIYDPRRGTVTWGDGTTNVEQSVDLYSNRYYVSVKLTTLGRVRICNPSTRPSGAPSTAIAFTGYPSC